MVSCMLSSTSSMAARTSSRIVRYCALRSTSGISVLVITVMSCWSPSLPLRCSRDAGAGGCRPRSSCLRLLLLVEPAVGMRKDACEACELRELVLQLDRGVAGPHASRRHLLAHD